MTVDLSRLDAVVSEWQNLLHGDSAETCRKADLNRFRQTVSRRLNQVVCPEHDKIDPDDSVDAAATITAYLTAVLATFCPAVGLNDGPDDLTRHMVKLYKCLEELGE